MVTACVGVCVSVTTKMVLGLSQLIVDNGTVPLEQDRINALRRTTIKHNLAMESKLFA